ncbi:MAG: transposase [Polyangiaceae bacterium]|nr:transposase [Polyangiaceae bacterium]
MPSRPATSTPTACWSGCAARGGVDRGVPLPRPLLSCLRRYWKLERPACSTPHLFVAEGRESRLHETTLQKIARRALPGVPLPPIPWEKRCWVVFAKPVAHGAEKVLEYLGRYVHRTAMSDRACSRWTTAP